MSVATATPEPDPTGPTGIVDVVGQYTLLRAGGSGPGDLTGTCPFCTSTAFHVRPTHGTYHCFRCGHGGDASSFATELEHGR